MGLSIFQITVYLLSFFSFIIILINILISHILFILYNQSPSTQNQFMTRQYYDFYGDSPSDIALSCSQYEDLVDAVNDDRLSPKALMKFKNLYRGHSLQLLVVPIFTFPLAWIANQWLTGFSNRGMAQSRFNFLGIMLFYPIALYWGYNRPIPRKLFTELLTDDSQDGDYIRDSLAHHKPGLWKKISEQLNDLNLQYRQSIKTTSSLEFPSNFVSSHSTIY